MAGMNQQHSRERFPEDLGAQLLLAVRQRLQELRHELGQVQQCRAAARQNALRVQLGREQASRASLKR